MPRSRAWSVPVLAVAAVFALLVSSLVGLSAGASPSSIHTGAGSVPGACTQTRVPLGAAGNFRILAGTTVTSTGNTQITGSLGLSPGSAVTGFPPGTVSGKIAISDKAASNGQSGLTTAIQNALARTTCPTLVSGNLGGKTLGPGLYDSTSSLAISSGHLTLNAHGNSGAIFIFQISTKFTMTSGRSVVLTGGARAANIYWIVGSSATLGTTCTLYGNILAHKSISMATGATLYGRALAQIGAVTLQDNTVS